jgi:hypothetical protein
MTKGGHLINKIRKGKNMEYENKYGSRGATGAALGLGIAGTALGVLNNGGGLGGILGGGNCNHPAYTRYDAEKDAIISRLETEVKLRDANTYTLGEVGKLRDYMESRLGVIEREICDQRTYNAVNTATISCIQGQIATLMGLTKTVIPNGSICPGWGNVTVTPAAAPAAGA